MDPLSAIASVIAISQALGIGVKALRSLANASAEFGDMLNELSTLQACVTQLCSVVKTMADPQLCLPGEVITRLETIQRELSQIVGAIDNIGARLLRGKHPMTLNKNGDPKVSAISWQRERSKVVKLRDRAKRCREDLSVCLGLLGVTEQLQQRRIGMEILAISHSQHFLMQAALTRFETRFDMLESVLSTSPNNALEAASEVHCAVSSVRPSINTQAPLRQPCARYCTCQCHKTSTLRSPSWTRNLMGSLLAQCSGGIWFKGPCDTSTCRWEPSRSVRVVYSFPEWLLGRAVFLSASWGSLTNVGASLYLAVPRVSEPHGVIRVMHQYHPDYFREKVAHRELIPTDILKNGSGYFAYLLNIACTPAHFHLMELFLDLGFNPSYVDPTGGSATAVAKWWLIQAADNPNLPPEACRILQRIAGEDEDYPEVSTLIRDSVLGISNVALQDALVAEPSRINTIDYLGYSPLHWAAFRGDFDKSQLLILGGAAVDLPTRPTKLTALHIATSLRDTRLVSLLIESGANLEARDFNGSTPLHLCRAVESVQILLAAGAKPNATSNMGFNALHQLAYFIGTKSQCSAAMSVMSELVLAGADYNLQNRHGSSPILTAAGVGNVAALQHLCSLGAAPNTADNFGNTILDYTSSYYGIQQLQALRTMGICGVDPDRLNHGYSVVQDFESRMFSPWLDTQRRPTQADVFSFYALVSEIRQRNWESGLFLYSKTMLETEGQVDQLRRWLGWQWQKVHDDDGFAQRTWDPERDEWPDEYSDDGSDPTDYNMSILFGGESKDDTSGYDLEQGLCLDDEEADEFFDALS